jgi:hypothetical protein
VLKKLQRLQALLMLQALGKALAEPCAPSFHASSDSLRCSEGLQIT